MSSFLVFTLILCSSTFLQAEARLFKFSSKDYPEAIWDDHEAERVENDTCECGETRVNRGYKPWYLFIMGVADAANVFCSGVVVSSNLIATSHECLQRPGKQYSIFDAWLTSRTPLNMYEAKDLRISTNGRTAKTRYQITTVIFNHQYGVHTATDDSRDDNIVLLRVAPDLTGDREITPICIPRNDEPILELLQTEVFPNMAYYGLVYIFRKPEHLLFDFKRTCYPDYNYGITFAEETKPKRSRYPVDIPGGVLPDAVCSGKSESEGHQLLCFQLYDEWVPVVGDGVVYVKTSDHKDFLLGITSANTTSLLASVRQVSFTKIQRIIKYIEYHAEKSGSMYCHRDPMLLQSVKAQQGRQQTYQPWAVPGAAASRDDTLKCACGIENDSTHGRATGRLIGGTDVIPNEFPWVVYLNVFKSGRNGAATGCTGTIINDIMVMTSAWCVTRFEDGNRTDRHDPNIHTVTALPATDIDVYINLVNKANINSAKLVKVTHVYFDTTFTGGHESSKVTPYPVDIGLLVLNEKLTFVQCGEGLRPGCVPGPAQQGAESGKYAVSVGWGGASPVSELTSRARNFEESLID